MWQAFNSTWPLLPPTVTYDKVISYLRFFFFFYMDIQPQKKFNPRYWWIELMGKYLAIYSYYHWLISISTKHFIYLLCISLHQFCTRPTSYLLPGYVITSIGITAAILQAALLTLTQPSFGKHIIVPFLFFSIERFLYWHCQFDSIYIDKKKN